MRLLIDCHCFDFEISQGITTYIQGIYSELPDLAQDIEFFFVASNIGKIKRIFGERKIFIMYLSYQRIRFIDCFLKYRILYGRII